MRASIDKARNSGLHLGRGRPFSRKGSRSLQAALVGLRGEIRLSEPLGQLTSLRIGGPADALFIPHDIDDLCRAVRQARDSKVPILILGGTNVLVRDEGYRGIVMQLSRLKEVRDEPHQVVYAQAGVRMPVLLRHAMNRALSGLEWAAGIPGTVGGGIVMNAGTSLGEIKDVLQAIQIVNTRGVMRTIPASALSFAYRHARIPKGVVVAGWFQLTLSTRKKIETITKRYLRNRKNTQPLSLPNAGSIFKNSEHRSAGWLIEQAGLKGAQIGDAQVSPKHANFIVNLGAARAIDVMRLIQKVRRTVIRKTGITLQLELKIVGEL